MSRRSDLFLKPVMHRPILITHDTLAILLLSFVSLLALPFLGNTAELTITVLDSLGNPAEGVAVQVFAGNLAPGMDTEPVLPPQKRRDGLVGFMTNGVGQVQVQTSMGDYSVVASSPKNAHRFCLTGMAQAPGSLILDARQAEEVTVQATDPNSEPIVGAGIYFRPLRRARGLTGFVGNDGVLRAHVSRGDYHVVLASSSLFYLVQPDVAVPSGSSSLAFDIAQMPTAELLVELPEDPDYSFSKYPNTWPALYEVLETELTYEYVEAIEEQIGYDAAYTDVWSLLQFGSRPEDAPVTVSAGLTYSLNMSYVIVTGQSAPVYAYELRPFPQRFPVGQHRVGNTGQEPFTLEISMDRPGSPPVYQPGDRVQMRYDIEDTRSNQMWRLFSFSDARLLFPLVTVTDPDGVVVATNPDTIDFFEYSFQLPTSARQGEYQVEVFLNAQLYGPLMQTQSFRVVAPPDQTPPVIEELTVAQTLEAGADLVVTARVSDASSTATVTLTVDGQTVPGGSIVQGLHTWSTPGLTLGQHTWELSAVDTFGNHTERNGLLDVVDTQPPVLSYTLPNHIEIGTATHIPIAVADASPIVSALLIYNSADEDMGRQSDPTSADLVVLELPSLTTAGSIELRAEVTDAAGNIGYLPGPDAETWAELSARDTLPPLIHRVHALPHLAGDPIPVQATVTDNHGIDQVNVIYADQSGQETVLPMTLSGALAAASLPPSFGGWEYAVEATDLADSEGLQRGTRSETHYTEPRKVAAITVIPESTEQTPLRVQAGTSLNLQAVIHDGMGEILAAPVLWTATGGIGQVDDNGRFSAFPAIRPSGRGEVIATPLLGQQDELQTARAWIEIISGPVSHIALLPNSTTVPSGTEQHFLAEALDRYGNPIEDSMEWTAPDGSEITEVIQLSPGLYQATLLARGTGTSTLRVHSADQTASALVTVTMGQPSELSIVGTDGEPLTARMQATAGNAVQLRATLADEAGNTHPALPLWYVRGNIGSIDATGRFEPSLAGTGQILAIWDGLVASLDVTVSPGLLHRITTEPFIDYLPLSGRNWDRTRQFVAHGWDVAGNPVPIPDLEWSTDPVAGTIDADGLFTATSEISDAVINNVVINGSVFARAQSPEGRKLTSTSVVVILHQSPGAIEQLQIVLENFGTVLDEMTLRVGETREFEVTGLDSRNRRVAVRPLWMVQGDIGTVTPDGAFTAQRPGVGTIVASWEGYSAQVELTVTPGLLTRLEIEPATAVLRVGETSELHARGYDPFGNRVLLDRVQWNPADTSVLVLAGNPTKVTARVPGITHVEARVGNIVAYAPLQVKPGQAHTLKWLNTVHELTAGQSFRWMAEVLDAAGNRLGGVPRWRVDGGIGTISPTGYFTAEIAGNGKIIAEVGGLRITHSLTVTQGLTTRVQISPGSLTLATGMKQELHTWGYDASGNRAPMDDVQWSLVGAGELIRTDLGNGIEVSSDSAGSLLVTAVADGLSAQSIVSVIAPDTFQSEALAIVPDKSVLLSIGRGQQYHVWSKMAGGAFLPIQPHWRAPDTLAAVTPTGWFSTLSAGTFELEASHGISQETASVIVEEIGPVIGNDVDVVVDEGTTEPGTLELLWEQASLTVGERFPLVAFARTSDNHRRQVTPHWWTTDTVLRVGDSSEAIAMQPGTAKLHVLWQEEQRNVVVEVAPGRGTYLRLSPEFSTFTRLRPGPMRFAPTFYDSHGYIAAPAGEPLTWRIVGGVGQIEQDGTFTADTSVPQSRQGEVLAILSDENIAGRAAVYFYGTQSDVAELRLEPSDLTATPGERIDFQAILLDASGRILSELPTWEIRNEQGVPIDGLISAAGALQLPVGQYLGESLEVVAKADGLTASAQVTVAPGALALLSIEPSLLTPLEVDDEVSFRAAGSDALGNPVAVTPSWTLAGNIGAVSSADAATTTFRATLTGEGILYATESGLSVSVPITVLAPAPDVLHLLPVSSVAQAPSDSQGQQASDPWLMTAGEEIQLRVFGADDEAVSGRLAWDLAVETTAGTLSSTGHFVAEKPGDIRIDARLDSAQGSFYIRVTPGPLAHITVRPSAVSVLTQETERFVADGTDAFGNPVSLTPVWSVLGGIGTVDAAGTFTPFPVLADQNWHGSVVASAENVSGSARVSITGERGPLVRLTFDVAATALQAGSSVVIQLRGWDAQGNLLPDVQATVTHTPEDGTLAAVIPGEWRYRASQSLPEPPEVRFQTAIGDIAAELVLPLIPADPSEIRIPELVAIAGEAIKFRPQVFDTFGNLIQDAIPVWSAGVGEIQVDGDDITYLSTEAGTAELVARLDGFEQRFTVDVSPAQAATLEVNPSEVQLRAGDVIQIRAQLTDAYGNAITPDTFEIQFKIEPASLASARSEETMTWQVKGVRSGTGHIKVQTEELSQTISLSVVAGLLQKLQIVLTGAPQMADGYHLTSGATYRCQATGEDAEGNTVQPEVQWALLGDVGELTPQGAEATIKARFVGEAQLLGTVDAITDGIALKVEPYRSEVGITGGNVTSPAGVALTFPSGALNAPQSVEIDLVRSVEPSEAANAPKPSSEAATRLTPVFRIVPEGLTFVRPIELRIDYGNTGVPSNAAAQIHFWDPFQQRWLPSGMTGSGASSSLSTHINHLGLFTVMQVDKPSTAPDQLAIRHVRISPPILYAPELNRATITFLLTTGAAASAEVSAILYDLRGREIVRLIDRETLSAGNNTLQWAGTNRQQEMVLNGRYVLLLVARADGETVVAKKLLVVFK